MSISGLNMINPVFGFWRARFELRKDRWCCLSPWFVLVSHSSNVFCHQKLGTSSRTNHATFGDTRATDHKPCRTIKCCEFCYFQAPNTVACGFSIEVLTLCRIDKNTECMKFWLGDGLSHQVPCPNERAAFRLKKMPQIVTFCPSRLLTCQFCTNFFSSQHW